MKKTLVALAALAVVGAASAQSTVTLYGKVSTGVRSVTTKVNGVKGAAGNVGLQVISSAIGGSRFGFKGSEDLGGGLKANFQLEQGFNSDTGTLGAATHQFSRQAWVGLSGSWGEFRGGEMYNAVDNIACGFDANFCYSATSTANGINSGNFIDISAVQTPGNMLQYATPNMSGFVGTVQYAPGENKNPAIAQAAGSFIGLQANYNAGPLGLGFAYERTKLTVAPVNTVKQWVLGASYDLGVAKLTGFIDRGSNSLNPAEDKGWHLGAVIPVSSMSLHVGMSREKFNDITGAFNNGKASMISVNLTYPLSKRTALYGEFNNGKTNTAAAVSVETKVQRWGFGVRHDF